jgi:hypothetical protein
MDVTIVEAPAEKMIESKCANDPRIQATRRSAGAGPTIIDPSTSTAVPGFTLKLLGSPALDFRNVARQFL